MYNYESPIVLNDGEKMIIIQEVIEKLPNEMIRYCPRGREGISLLFKCTREQYNKLRVGCMFKHIIKNDGTQEIAEIIMA